MKKVNINEKFQLFNDHWTPKIIGELNGQHLKLAKVKGDFVWHDHADEDELFLVYKGVLCLDFRDGTTVELHPGEFYIVPKAVEHRPWTKGEEGRENSGDLCVDLVARPQGCLGQEVI